MSHLSFKNKVRKYFKFEKTEIRNIIIISLIFGFIASYRAWGEGAAFVSVGLKNLFNSILIVISAIIVHESAHKLAGVIRGHKVKISAWWPGIFGALILCIVSRGKLWFFGLSGIFLQRLPSQKLGKYRYDTRKLDISMVALAGPMANIVLATFLKTLVLWFPTLPLNTALIHQAFLINWVIAICNLLPIPPLDGVHIFFQSRLLFITIFGFILGYGILIYFGIYSWIWALTIAAIIWILFYRYFERGAVS